jgi:hypothetical protein
MKHISNFKLFESDENPLVRKLDDLNEIEQYLGGSSQRTKRREPISVSDLIQIHKSIFELANTNSFTKIGSEKLGDFMEESEIEIRDLRRILEEGAQSSLDRLYNNQISMMKSGSSRMFSCRKPGKPIMDFNFYKFEDEWWLIRMEGGDLCFWLCDGYDGLEEFGKTQLY